MERTQIMLTKQLKQELSLYSQEHSKSLSQVLRELAERFLFQQKRQVGVTGLLRLVDIAGKNGQKNLSREVDDILYSL